jgi:hypothetical protein
MAIAMAAPAALAQTQPAGQTPAPPPAGAAATQSGAGPTPNDTELKQFAHAAVDVEQIKKSLQPKLAAAKSPDDRTKLKQNAEKKMEAAVRSNHLSIHRYVQIAQVVQQNSAIRAKVQGYMPPQSSSKS